MYDRYIIFDTETTGIIKNLHAHPSCSQAYPHIVQLAWRLYYKNKCYDRNRVIRPDGFDIPEESVKFHGIRTETARAIGVPIEKVLQEFYEDVKKVDVLVAHNAEFDSRIIASECYRKGIPDFLRRKSIICTMKSTTSMCKLPGMYGFKYPRLEELYIYLFKKKPKGKLHDASVDVDITDRCWTKIKNNRRKWVFSYNVKC